MTSVLLLSYICIFIENKSFFEFLSTQSNTYNELVKEINTKICLFLVEVLLNISYDI